MKVLALEWLSSQPAAAEEGPSHIPPALRNEGFAMLAVLVEGLLRGGHEVTTLLPAGSRVDSAVQHQARLWQSSGVEVIGMEADLSTGDVESTVLGKWRQLASDASVAWLVAPEINDVLSKAINCLAPQVRLINCQGPALDTASDKWQTAAAFRSHGIAHPTTQLLSQVNPIRLRCSDAARMVAKRRDGAGCEGTRLLSSHAAVEELKDSVASAEEWILQPWIEGEAYSLSAFVGPHGTAWMIPVRQDVVLVGDSLQYGGAKVLAASPKREAMFHIAAKALKSLGGGIAGWIGIDLVFSLAEARWYAIEVNPRLTSSCGELAAAHCGCLVDDLLRSSYLGEVVDLPRPGGTGVIFRFDPIFSP